MYNFRTRRNLFFNTTQCILCRCIHFIQYTESMRYLEGMIKTASVIDDNSKADEVGLFDKVEVYMPEDDETDIIQVVTTVRCDPRKGLISMDSPFGKQILGKKVGDKFTVHVSDTYSYEAEIRSITKTDDDGSAPLMSY